MNDFSIDTGVFNADNRVFNLKFLKFLDEKFDLILKINNLKKYKRIIVDCLLSCTSQKCHVFQKCLNCTS